jgi:hypothetical protein
MLDSLPVILHHSWVLLLELLGLVQSLELATVVMLSEVMAHPRPPENII